MKGVLIFDDRADLAFFSLDEDMEEFILDRMQGLDKEAGASVEESKKTHRDMRDCLSAFFLPFFTSFDVLNTLKKPILSITGMDGHLIVFRKFGGDVYIAISREDGETEETMGRKLCVLNCIITILYGPVSSKINTPDLSARDITWKRISSLLNTYENLYLTDQVFLVEALEHVQFGQLSAAANVVQRLTRDSLDPQYNGGLPGVKHAMLLANTKFLAMCGRSPRIETSDILLINLLVHHFFVEMMGLDEDIDEKEEDEEKSEESDEDEKNDGDLFKTPRSTPGLGSKEAKQTAGDDDLFMDDRHFELSTSSRKIRETQSMNITSTRALQDRFKTALASLRSFNRMRTGAYSKPYARAPVENSRFMEQLVFLQPNPGHFIPHFLYCLEVYPGIMLVMVAEHGDLQNLAGHLCQTLKHLESTGIFAGTTKSISSSGQSMYEILDESIRRIKDQINRECEKIRDPKKVEILRNIHIRGINKAWSNLKQSGMKTYLEKSDKSSSKDEEGFQLAKLEACGSDLREKLLKLFEVLFMSPRKREFDTNQVVRKLMRHFNPLNQDYGEFLALKGNFNIPIISFSMSFPGMIHFLFIDRSFDELTSPSLAADEQVAISYVQNIAKRLNESPTVFLRRKIWNMVQRAQKYLGLGYTLQTWLDDDFLYTYFLWINVPSNAALGTPIRFFIPSNIKCNEYSAPGVIGSPFFSDIHTIKEGYVYELYCMHKADIPIKEASLHCRNLAEQLWPSLREAVAPFSLIN